MLVTLEVFQEERSPMDQVVALRPAEENMLDMVVTLEVFHEERSERISGTVVASKQLVNAAVIIEI